MAALTGYEREKLRILSSIAKSLSNIEAYLVETRADNKTRSEDSVDALEIAKGYIDSYLTKIRGKNE